MSRQETEQLLDAGAPLGVELRMVEHDAREPAIAGRRELVARDLAPVDGHPDLLQAWQAERLRRRVAGQHSEPEVEQE